MPQRAVADEFDEAGRHGGARVLGEGLGHPVGEREEHAVGVAGLGHPVRDHEQGLAGDQRNRQDQRPLGGQLGQAQREPVARRQGPYAVGRDHQRRLMAEVDDLHGAPAVVGEADQDAGGEAVTVVAAHRRAIADLPEHPHLQAVGDGAQDGFVVRRLTERAEQRGRRLHRAQPLALHIAKEQPGAAGARLDVEEVTADPGLAVGGEIDGRVLQAAPARRQRAQHRAPGGLGDIHHVQHAPLAADPDHTRQDREDAAHADEDEVGQPGLVLVLPGIVHRDVGEERETPEGRRGPHPADRRRDGRDEDDPGDDPELAGGVPVRHGDADEQDQRRHPGDAAAAQPQQPLPLDGVVAPLRGQRAEPRRQASDASQGAHVAVPPLPVSTPPTSGRAGGRASPARRRRRSRSPRR